MAYLFTGYQVLNFKTDDGSQIDGINFFLVGDDERVTGRKAFKKFISRQAVNKMNLDLDSFIGQNVMIAFDEKGRIVIMQLAK